MKNSQKKKKYKGKYVYKNYAHFDNKKQAKTVYTYIEKPKNIAKHQFMPFILDEKKYKKYSKKKGRYKKERPICFSAHTDRYIYQLYNYKLNKRYNEYATENDIEDCAVAYRKVNRKITNIKIAKEVFLNIKKEQKCYIIIGDFKHFFDRLNHQYLKNRLCEILGVNENKLPQDYYKVYRSITKYAYFDMKDIVKSKNQTKTEIYKLKKIYSDIKEFRKSKKMCLQINKNSYGIPQGSPISSVLSNIYMMKADKEINCLAKRFNGMYRRYSDDFMFMAPNINKDELEKIYNEILKILEEEGNPILEPEKTQIFYYDENCLNNITKEFIPNVDNISKNINYLGFCFDGVKVRIRDKSLSKYYYRVYKKIETIVRNKGYIKKGDKLVKISNHNLYELYSNKGDSNFVTYNKRVENEFSDTDMFVTTSDKFYSKIKKRLRREKAYSK